MQIIPLIALIGIFSLLGVSFHEAFGDGFMDFPTRLKHSPIFCALEPQPNSQMPTLSKVLADVTSNAVFDWKNKLNERTDRHPVWNMDLIQIPLSKQSNFDYSKCDVMINYLPKPNLTNLGFVATGITIPNMDTGKTRIEIYYTMLEVDTKKITWTDGGKIYYSYVNAPVYLDGAIETEPQLEGIMRHEIGHSLGLGHYLISNDERDRIVAGAEDMPSIMIDTTTTFGVTHYDITPLDVSQIKNIYGTDGFNGGISSRNFQKIDVVTTDKKNYNNGEPVNVEINANNFNDNTKGMLMHLDPDGMLLGVGGVTKTNSTFQLKTDNKIGVYHVEFIDFGNDLYGYSTFTVSGGNTMNSLATTNNHTNIIPNWVKNNAHYWSIGSIGDGDFVKGIQYMIQQKIITIPSTKPGTIQPIIPSWIKTDAKLWSEGEISDDDFIKALQYLVSNGIIML